jgi:hypothetical protein
MSLLLPKKGSFSEKREGQLSGRVLFLVSGAELVIMSTSEGM